MNAQDNNTNKNEDMNTYKKTVTLWYEAFTKKDPALLEQILHDGWVDMARGSRHTSGPCRCEASCRTANDDFP